MLRSIKTIAKEEEVQKSRFEEKKNWNQGCNGTNRTIEGWDVQPYGQNTKAIEVGGYAQIRNGTSIGKILSIRKEMAELNSAF